MAQGQAAQSLDVTVLEFAAELDHLLTEFQRRRSVTPQEHALRHAHQYQATLATWRLALE